MTRVPARRGPRADIRRGAPGQVPRGMLPRPSGTSLPMAFAVYLAPAALARSRTRWLTQSGFHGRECAGSLENRKAEGARVTPTAANPLRMPQDPQLLRRGHRLGHWESLRLMPPLDIQFLGCLGHVLGTVSRIRAPPTAHNRIAQARTKRP